MASNAAFPTYLQAFRPASAMNANRFDEGYSEDTRSQSGSDMIMRTDLRLGDDGMEQELQYALPDEVMQMSESERSGMSRQCLPQYPAC
jgi:F-box and WD-40 domain protein 1/11